MFAVFQYEDHEEDRVTVGSKFDIEDAFSVYDHMKSVSHHIPTLKLYLRNVAEGKLSHSESEVPFPSTKGLDLEDRLVHSNPNINAGEMTHLNPSPHALTPIANHVTRKSFSGSNATLNGFTFNGSVSPNITRRSGSFDTPPLRTPPPSPPPEPSSLNNANTNLSLETPPLRTPPPSPPRSRNGSIGLGEVSTNINLMDSGRLESPSFTIEGVVNNSSVYNVIQSHPSDINHSRHSSTETPPLRTPPRSQSNSSIEFMDEEQDDQRVASDEPNAHQSFLDEQLDNGRLGTPKGSKHATQAAATTSEVSHPHWKRGQLLGKGGFGNVYLGLNNDTGELFAVKQLDLDSSGDEKAKRSMLAYQQEIEVMKKLNHPNIVRYIGTQLDNNAMYIFLEFVPGGSIRSILNKFGPLTERSIRIYTKQILCGLQYLHDNSIIHRDIKGANILLGTNGTVKLADFGCAKIFAGLHSNFKSVLGTPYWMAPEVIRADGYGRSADIWSLGCTIIEMVTTKPPWSTEFPEPAAAMFHIASASETPQIPEHLSPESHDFLLRCFRRDPRERPDAVMLLNHAFIRKKDGGKSRSPSPSPRNSLDVPVTRKNSVVLGNEDKVSLHNAISLLPSNVMFHIFGFLKENDLAQLRLVCKNWKLMLEDDMIWRYRTLKNWEKAKRVDDKRWKDLYYELEKHDEDWYRNALHAKVFKGKAHTKCINAVAFNSTIAATASDDKKIKIWDITKTRSLKSLKGHTAAVNSLCFVDQNPVQLFSGSSDNVVKLWDIKSKKCLKQFESHTGTVTSLQCRGTRLVSASLDKLIKMWDISTGKLICTLVGHKAGILGVVYQEHTILTCSTDQTIKMFDTRMEKCTRTFEGHADEVTCVQFDQQNHVVLSGSVDKTLKEWDLGSGNCIATLAGHSEAVRSCSFDNNKIISGSLDKSIKIWDRHRSNICVRTLQVHHLDGILSLQHDNSKILSVGRDKTLRMLQVSSSLPSKPETSFFQIKRNGKETPL